MKKQIILTQKKFYRQFNIEMATVMCFSFYVFLIQMANYRNATPAYNESPVIINTTTTIIRQRFNDFNWDVHVQR